MDKQMLQGMKDMQEAVRDFEERPSRIGQGVADLFNKVVPEHELAIVKGMIEEAITGAINASY